MDAKIKKINIQYFATFQENITLVEQAIGQDLYAIMFFNYFHNSTAISNDNMHEMKNIITTEMNNFRSVHIIFSYKPFVMVDEYNEFCEKNKDAIYLTVGAQNNGKLIESWLASSIFLEDINSYLEFSKLAKTVKKITKCGATLYMENIARKYEKNVRYTIGAYNFSEDGGFISQDGGTGKIHFKLGVNDCASSED